MSDPTTPIPSAHVPGRPVLSEKCRQRIAELVETWPPLSDHQRAVIANAFRTERRLRQARERAA